MHTVHDVCHDRQTSYHGSNLCWAVTEKASEGRGGAHHEKYSRLVEDEARDLVVIVPHQVCVLHEAHSSVHIYLVAIVIRV